MDIGKKLKELRLKNGMTLDDLASRSELTKGFLSQVERNLTAPSIATLEDILEALGSNLSEFFREEPKRKVVFSTQDFWEAKDQMEVALGQREFLSIQMRKANPLAATLSSALSAHGLAYSTADRHLDRENRYPVGSVTGVMDICSFGMLFLLYVRWFRRE